MLLNGLDSVYKILNKQNTQKTIIFLEPRKRETTKQHILVEEN